MVMAYDTCAQSWSLSPDETSKRSRDTEIMGGVSDLAIFFGNRIRMLLHFPNPSLDLAGLGDMEGGIAIVCNFPGRSTDHAA